MISLKLEGMAGVQAALDELIAATSSRTGKAALQRGLIKAAAPMVERAKAHVPVRSGRLRNSIKASARLTRNAGKRAYGEALRAGLGRDQAGAYARYANRVAKANSPPVVIYVGPGGRGSRPAHLVEFGTRPHKIRPRRKGLLQWPASASGGRSGAAAEVDHPGTRPQSYLRRAYYETRDEVLARVAGSLREEIAKAAQRAAARGRRKG